MTGTPFSLTATTSLVRLFPTKRGLEIEDGREDRREEARYPYPCNL